MFRYIWFECIDEVDEYGYNSITFHDKNEALEYYNNNLSHWTSGIDTDDLSFSLEYPSIVTYYEPPTLR